MKILHTSDWHIGKRLAGKERLEEQRAVLEEIASICEREGVELVLVAGDIFDTYLPSAEAEDVYYEAIRKIAGDRRSILLISGNHDDPVRLSAATALSEELGIYVYGNFGAIPKVYKNRRTSATEADANHIVFRGESGDEVYINVLPYPNEARLREDKNPDESYPEKMQRWMNAGQAANERHLPSVFLSHLFLAGGTVSEGEREIDLGGARAVPLRILPPCDYVALGHLHKRQAFKNNVVYSGSILQYSFDEAGAEKSVVVFDLGKNGAENIQRIPLRSGKKLVRLATTGVSEAVELVKRYPDHYIELTVYLREPLLAEQVHAIKESNAGVLMILPKVEGAGQTSEGVSLRQLTTSELFNAYYRSLYAQTPPKDLTELFLVLTEDADET